MHRRWILFCVNPSRDTDMIGLFNSWSLCYVSVDAYATFNRWYSLLYNVGVSVENGYETTSWSCNRLCPSRELVIHILGFMGRPHICVTWPVALISSSTLMLLNVGHDTVALCYSVNYLDRHHFQAREPLPVKYDYITGSGHNLTDGIYKQESPCLWNIFINWVKWLLRSVAASVNLTVDPW